jgi:hypothetical protein
MASDFMARLSDSTNNFGFFLRDPAQNEERGQAPILVEKFQDSIGAFGDATGIGGPVRLVHVISVGANVEIFFKVEGQKVQHFSTV